MGYSQENPLEVLVQRVKVLWLVRRPGDRRSFFWQRLVGVRALQRGGVRLFFCGWVGVRLFFCPPWLFGGVPWWGGVVGLLFRRVGLGVLVFCCEGLGHLLFWFLGVSSEIFLKQIFVR